MRQVAIIGVGAHPSGQFQDKSLKDIAYVAIREALKDAGLTGRDIEVGYFANSLGGSLTGQEGIRGQVVFQHSGINDVPVINVENACASAATALRGAWLEVASGAADVAIAVGAEKMFVGDNARTIRALSGLSELDFAQQGLQFTASYAIHPKINIKQKMADYGWTLEDLAKPAVKNSANGARNPIAQHRKPLSIEDVVESRIVVDPLRLLMCSSVSDGAAAAILVPVEILGRFADAAPVEIAAAILRSGHYKLPGRKEPDPTTTISGAAYEVAGIGPEDIEVVELHDAMAPSELVLCERLGFCGPGEGPRLIDEGVTTLTGRMPVNPSGGLCSRGHPVGATGLLQIYELVSQMRGRAGVRQIQRPPRVGMAHNQGGLMLGGDSAAHSIVILKSQS